MTGIAIRPGLVRLEGLLRLFGVVQSCADRQAG